MQDLVAATSTLGRRAREELLALARLRGLREEFIGDRFARYPLVARRFDGQGLAAFLFFDRAERTADRTLLYLGPLVSRDGAYLPLFVTLVERWVDEPRGFWALAEVESARVDASFRSVLPSFVISEASRPDARRLAVPVVHAFQHAFPPRTRLRRPDLHDASRRADARARPRARRSLPGMALRLRSSNAGPLASRAPHQRRDAPPEDRVILFAQIREDGEVERRAFEGAAHVLAVASGGCVAFGLLDDHVQSVDAVDASCDQIELLHHKRRAIEALDREAFLVAAGEREGDRAALARAFRWPDALTSHGLLHAGANERFYRFVGRNLRRNVLPSEAWDALLEAPDVDAQRRWLRAHAESEGWRAAIRVLLSRTTHEHFFPPEPFAQVEETCFGDFFEERFVHELGARRVFDNPFLHQLLDGRYPEHARPRYLTEAGYASARRNLAKLRVVHAGLHELPEPDAPYDAITLSNVFDWATPSSAEAIARRVREVAAPGARVVVRQMLDARPIPEALGLVDVVEVEDRAMLYRRVCCGRLS